MAGLSRYTILQSETGFVINKDGNVLRTPMGTVVETNFKVLAERLVGDLTRYGEDPANAASIVAFHYAMLEFFLKVPRSQLEENVSSGLDKGKDWTLHCPSAEPQFFMRWLGLFGNGQAQSEAGKEWLKSISLMQLCAVCVIGRATESVNIPYLVATKLQSSGVKSFVKTVVGHYPYIAADELVKYLDNFLFYFNLES